MTRDGRPGLRRRQEGIPKEWEGPSPDLRVALVGMRLDGSVTGYSTRNTSVYQAISSTATIATTRGGR